MQLLPYASLALAHLSLLIGQRVVALVLIAISVTLGFSLGRIDVLGLVGLAFFAGFSYCWKNSRLLKWQNALAGVFVFIIAMLLLSHRVPGFNNWKYLDAYYFSANALPFTLFLNLDKPFIFSVLFFFYTLTNQSELSSWKAILRYTLISAAILLVPALIARYIALEPKWDMNIIVWALNNFFFVCAAEEMLFRGFIQTELEKLTKKPIVALVIASMLFGLVHFAGGVVYVGLATLAGLVYGISYQKTGRIIIPMAVHFLVNLLHILLFTYPALKGSL